MSKIHRFRERVLKGNTKLLTQRAKAHGFTKDQFIQKLATCELIVLDCSVINMLLLQGSNIPKNLKTVLPAKIVKKEVNNTEIIDFYLTDDEYDELFNTACRQSFTCRGNIGQLLDKVAIFEVIFSGVGTKFTKEVKNDSKCKKY